MSGATVARVTTVDGPAGPLTVHVTGEPIADGTLVLVHPINTAGSVWEHVAAALDVPVVALDLRGHGTSTMDGPFSIEGGWLPDVMAVLDALGLRRVRMAGGSLGGTISLAAAALHPERVLGVATLGSTLGMGAPDDAIDAMVRELKSVGTAAYFDGLRPAVVGTAHRDDPRVKDGLARAAGRRDEDVVAAILHGAFRADIRHIVDRVTVPVIAATGTEDPTCPPEMTAEIAAATGTDPILLDGVGHLPMLEVPDRVTALLSDLLEATR